MKSRKYLGSRWQLKSISYSTYLLMDLVGAYKSAHQFGNLSSPNLHVSRTQKYLVANIEVDSSSVLVCIVFCSVLCLFESSSGTHQVLLHVILHFDSCRVSCTASFSSVCNISTPRMIAIVQHERCGLQSRMVGVIYCKLTSAEILVPIILVWSNIVSKHAF